VVAGLTGLRLRIFLHDFGSGATKLISSSSLGSDAATSSDFATVSSDGSRVAFISAATNLVGAASNGKLQVYVKNVATGETKLASSTSGGTQGNNDSALITVSTVNQGEDATISSDGTYVAFTSRATNLVTGGNGQQHVYRKNMTTGDVQIVSEVETAPAVWTQGNGTSNAPSISADGRYVAFVSKSTNLVTPATDVGAQHIFVRDMVTGTVQLASVNSAGVRGTGASWAPLVSNDGTVLAFSSDANNLVASDSNGVRDAFLHMLGTQTGLVGDVNGDGLVDVNDLSTMINEWKTRTRDPYTSHLGTGGDTINADINGDGKLNRIDVDLLLSKLLPLGL
jgi:Tol biopolymer transport system component